MTTTTMERVPKTEIQGLTATGKMLQFVLSQDGALDKHATVEAIKSLTALMREERDYQAKVDFTEALSRCQSQMRRISADATNPQTRSRYATYAKLDSSLRPIYASESFSLSFGTEEGPQPETMRVICYVSRGGYERKYQIDMPADGKGAKGGDVMTKTHATGAAASYGMRYLLKMIFNVAVGEDDTDGNLRQPVNPRDEAQLQEWADALRQCDDLNTLKTVFADAYKFAKTLGEGPKRAMTDVYEASKRKLGGVQ